MKNYSQLLKILKILKQQKINKMPTHSRINPKNKKYIQAELPRQFIEYFGYHVNEVKQMESIKQAAEAHEDIEIKNIADLDSVSIDLELKEEIVNEGKPDEWSYKYFEQDDEKYKVPVSVLSQLKTHLENTPGLLTFRVNRKGEGLKTKYTVIPLEIKAGKK